MDRVNRPGKRTVLLSGAALTAVAMAGVFYWPELVLRYRFWRFVRDPAEFREALKAAPADPAVRQVLERFVHTREGAALLISTFLEGYERSLVDQRTFLAEMEQMVLALHPVTPGPNQQPAIWEIPFAFVKSAGGRGGGAGQYQWSSERAALNPGVLHDLMPFAACREAPLPDRPGVKARVVDVEGAPSGCGGLPDWGAKEV